MLLFPLPAGGRVLTYVHGWCCLIRAGSWFDFEPPSYPPLAPSPSNDTQLRPSSRFLCQTKNSAQGQLQIFNLEAKSRLKSHTISEPIVFWRWFDATTIALVTASAVFHWSMEGDSGPQKIFNRDAKLEGCQVRASGTFLEKI